MKKTLFLIFLLCTTFAGAITLEHISYVPIKSGNYYNLITKGNTVINNLATYSNSSAQPVNIYAYSSFLDLISPSVTITNLKSDNNVIFTDYSSSNGYTVTIPTLNMTGGGALSSYGNVVLGINNITYATPSTSNTVDLYTETLVSNVILNVESLKIDGLTFPACDKNYAWQTVNSVAGNPYLILVCPI